MQDITSSLDIHLLSLLPQASALPVSARNLARTRRDNAESKFPCVVYLSCTALSFSCLTENVDSSTSPSFRMHLIISRSKSNPDLLHLMY
ncbi:hypothetical protein DFH11DRAFT_1605322 [Phellopilus nigrolimitatus]|nr:hypothetical protein DFH11DRAFT_1605322 [Phellopilus nigrolimitatus]